jgi:ABC-2 type transport system ATP-binding protein
MEDLSRGMQQKVALARALLTSPVLLLLDEPTTGLDLRSKREAQALICDLRAAHDTAILLCTHDLADAEMLAERVGILHAGRLLALEPTEELNARYGASTLEDACFTATATSGNRAHRQGRQGERRPAQRRPSDDDAADRRRDLVLPRNHLRDPESSSRS